MDPREAYALIKIGVQVVSAPVKKMRCATFFGDHLLLQRMPTPYGHDEFPAIPFVGYIDRWGNPYGVPRQIRGEVEEVSARRSMSLAMLKHRRIQIEADAVSPAGDNERLRDVHAEMNKLDGMAVLAKGGLSKIKVDELAQLSPYQIQLMQTAEYEIRDITGSDAPYYQGEQAQSGVAKEKDAQNSQITTISLSDNLRRSMSMLGEQVMSNMQSSWTYEKVLRITDRVTGAERFVKINEQTGGTVKNRIAQIRFDIVVSEAMATDTVREKNMDLLYEAIAKSPPEAAPTLLMAAFELSDLPNKDVLVMKLKPLLGLDPLDEEMDPEERKKQILEQLDAQRQKAAEDEALAKELTQTEIQNRKLENEKLEAEIALIRAKTDKEQVETEVTAEEHETEMSQNEYKGIEAGLNLTERIRQMKEGNANPETKAVNE